MRIFKMEIVQDEDGVEVIQRTDTKSGEVFYAGLGMLDRPVAMADGMMSTQSTQIEFKIPVSSVSRAFKEREKWFDKTLAEINAREPKIVTPHGRN